MKFPFSAEDLLHVYTMVWPKREPHKPLLKGNHYLRLKNPCQPQTTLVTDNPNKDLFLDEFVWVQIIGNFGLGTMVSGRSRGIMVVFLTLSVSFTESLIFTFVKFLILILVSIAVQILVKNSNAGPKSAKRLFKLLTTGEL